MTEFGDQFEGAAWPSFGTVHGQSVTYNPLGVAGSAITASWSPRDVEPLYLNDGELQRKGGTLKCSPSDVTSPSDRDTFTISSVTYAVERVVRGYPTVVLELVSITERTIGRDRKARQ